MADLFSISTAMFPVSLSLLAAPHLTAIFVPVRRSFPAFQPVFIIRYLNILET